MKCFGNYKNHSDLEILDNTEYSKESKPRRLLAQNGEEIPYLIEIAIRYTVLNAKHLN
jgi:hypothetical protein